MKFTPPLKNGVPASATWLPTGDWNTLLEFLCFKFPDISENNWISRMQRQMVLDESGLSVDVDAPFQSNARIYYYREVDNEIKLPFKEQILYQDEHLLVADKPHFMQIIPRGQYLHETLQVRLQNQLKLPELSPLHRLDRETAGIVLFSKTPETRHLYQNLFAKREMHKVYHAIAAADSSVKLPTTVRSRIERGEPFFRMKEVAGEANSETHIEVLQSLGESCLYKLQPITGKTHQLRVHMASLGIAIENDPCYPRLNLKQAGDYSKPLKLLAKSIGFQCPRTGEDVFYESNQKL